MLRIIVCDDDKADLERTEGLIREYMAGNPEVSGSITALGSSDALLERLESKDSYDICIMDVVMPGCDGIALGRRIRESRSRCAIVYVTSSEEYALKAFGVYADGYLLKPLEREPLFECLSRIITRMQGVKEPVFVIRTRDGLERTTFGHIMRVENASRVMRFSLDDGSVVESVYIRRSFEDELETLLREPRFIQPHKSFVINMEYVVKLLSSDLQMQDGTLVPISRGNLSAVKKRYLKYLRDI